MVTLLAVGFVAGIVTVISPCVLPVLPVVLAGGTTGSKRRAVAIVVGLTGSFALATLFGVVVLSALGLPEDLLEDVGIALLALLAIGLVVDPVGALLEKPFARLSIAPKVGAGTSSGVLLGAGLGLGFAPCAGPILAAITTAGARHHLSWTAVALTAAYALGVALPLLAIALFGQGLGERWGALRAHARAVRRGSGVLIGAMAVVIATGGLTSIQDAVPSLGLNAFVTPSVQAQLQRVDGEGVNTYAAKQQADPASSLPDLGPAANFAGIDAWLHTPGDRPLTLAALRGKVVLLDFWTYSCINCRRSIPHVEAWYQRYHADGLVVVGVSTPEFAFEHVVSNVASAAGSLGITYPIAIDDEYGTWTAYNNHYWPAEYLIDQDGNVRHTAFGEGDYTTTEADIRALLVAGGHTHLPPPTDVPNRTPTEATTPESYVGTASYSYADNIENQLQPGSMANYALPSSIYPSSLALGGDWDVHQDDAVAGPSAQIELSFLATDVYLVLGGHGTVGVSLNGAPATTLHVDGIPNLYTLFAGTQSTSGVLTLSFSRGVAAYDFTFG